VSGRLPLYKEYNESGVEWLGRIPSHWTVVPLKRLVLRLQTGTTPPTELERYYQNGTLAWYGPSSFEGGLEIGWPIKLLHESAIDEGRARCFAAGTVLIVGIGATIGKSALATTRCSANQQITALEFDNKRLLPRFATYSVQRLERVFRERAQYTTIPIMNQAEIGVYHLSVPPPDEQTQIAKFLDYETAKIDALIAKQQQLIALLQEKRQAVISHAVTKGLNPAAPLRDSGVAWLGQVPAHWEVKRAKVLFNESKGRSAKGEEELLTVSHLTGVTPRSEKDVNMFQAESHEGYKLCEPQDLVINTMWAWMGALGIAPQKGMVSPSYNVYTPAFEGDTWYFDHLVRTPAFIAEIIRWSKGVWSSRLRLYPYEFGQILLPLPPAFERVQIAEYLTFELDRYDKIMQAAAHQVELLQERRTALISAAVTGKIDVRGWQPPPAAAGGFDEPHGAKAAVLSNDAG
jgi:type I restriction enzyme S subunit